MSENAKQTPPITPSKSDRLKPVELLVFSGVLALFAGGVVLFATRNWSLTAIFAGAAFIVSVMIIALIGLGMKPNAQDVEARKDLGA